MKTIYLHIGYNKTGTTAIQRAFFKNRKLLEDNHLFYPFRCRGERKSAAHHSLAESLLFGCNRPLPSFVNQEIYRNHSRDHYWNLLHEELAKQQCSKIFISSEAFSRFGECEHQIETVKNQLYNYDVKILIFLREQIEYLESAYNQAIKYGNETRKIQAIINDGLSTLNYLETIDSWAKVFGQENMLVRIYKKANLANGIVADVLKVIGLEDLTKKESLSNFLLNDKTDYNPRLPNNLVEVKRLINIFSNLTGKKTLHTDNKINKALTRLGKKNKDRHLINSKNAKKIRDHFYAVNVELGQKYFNGHYPF